MESVCLIQWREEKTNLPRNAGLLRIFPVKKFSCCYKNIFVSVSFFGGEKMEFARHLTDIIRPCFFTQVMANDQSQCARVLGRLSNEEGDVNEERQNSNKFRSAKQKFCTLFCTFLCRHCTTTTWKCLFSRFVEDVNTTEWLSFFFPELRYSILEFNSTKKLPKFDEFNEME